MDKSYVIMDNEGVPVGKLQAMTLRKMLSYTSKALRDAQKLEGFLLPTEKTALEEIQRIQATHTELI